MEPELLIRDKGGRNQLIGSVPGLLEDHQGGLLTANPEITTHILGQRASPSLSHGQERHRRPPKIDWAMSTLGMRSLLKPITRCDDRRAFFAEAFLEVRQGYLGVLDGIVDQASDDRSCVQTELG